MGAKNPEWKINQISAQFESGSPVIQVQLAVLNPNSFDVKVEALEYKIINSKKSELANGKVTEVIQLKSNETVSVHLPVKIKLENIIEIADTLYRPGQEIKIIGSAIVEGKNIQFDVDKKL
jgi:LEA14-like dessication related protein